MPYRKKAGQRQGSHRPLYMAKSTGRVHTPQHYRTPHASIVSRHYRHATTASLPHAGVPVARTPAAHCHREHDHHHPSPPGSQSPRSPRKHRHATQRASTRAKPPTRRAITSARTCHGIASTRSSDLTTRPTRPVASRRIATRVTTIRLRRRDRTREPTLHRPCTLHLACGAGSGGSYTPLA